MSKRSSPIETFEIPLQWERYITEPALRTLLAASLAGMPQETQDKYNAYGALLMSRWASKAMKHPEKVVAGKNPIFRYVGRRLMK